MYRQTIVVDEHLDIESTIQELTVQLTRQSISFDQETITNQCRSVLTNFAEQSARLSSAGSSLNARQQISGSGYEISIVARSGYTPTLVEKLVNFLTRRDRG